MIVVRRVVMVVVYCPTDVLAKAAVLCSIVGFARWHTALWTDQHLEVAAILVRFPDLVCLLWSGQLFKDVVLIIAIL